MQVPHTKSFQRITKWCTLFIVMSTLVVFVVGRSIHHIHEEIKELRKFVEISAEVQPNFESSLLMYTESSKELIDRIFSLRPDNELEYIEFISKIEDIALKLDIDVELTSAKPSEEEPETSTLRYNIDFYGSWDDLETFLSELERLPYFIKVSEIQYRALPKAPTEEKTDENIHLTLELYVQ